MNFQDLFDYQRHFQSALLGKIGINLETLDYGSPGPHKGWGLVHLAINMADNVIEEAIELKRLFKERKIWAKGDPQTTLKYTDPETRGAILDEYVDILVQWTNLGLYLEVTEEELQGALKTKLRFNATRTDHLGNPDSPSH